MKPRPGLQLFHSSGAYVIIEAYDEAKDLVQITWWANGAVPLSPPQWLPRRQLVDLKTACETLQTKPDQRTSAEDSSETSK